MKLLVGVPLSALLLALLVSPAAAQGFSGLDDVDATGMSYNRFVRPGEATVELLMLGNAAPSGLYVVGMDMGLAEFLALSGVTFGSTSGRERTRVTVQIYRQHGTGRQLVFEAPVEDVLTAPAQVPAFQSGDIVYLEAESRTRVDWFRVVQTLSSVASLAFVIERLISSAR